MAITGKVPDHSRITTVRKTEMLGVKLRKRSSMQGSKIYVEATPLSDGWGESERDDQI